MTTIAYRNDTLVADCRSVRAGWIAEDFPNKVRRLADGTVAAFTGEVGQGEMGVAWLANGRPDPQPDFDDCTILHMREPGVLHIYDGRAASSSAGRTAPMDQDTPPPWPPCTWAPRPSRRWRWRSR